MDKVDSYNMKCNNCNNIINYGYTLCPYCGEYISYPNLNKNIKNYVNKEENKNSAYYTNYLVVILFCLSFILFSIELSKEILNYLDSFTYESDYFLLFFIPTISFISILPIFIGLILSFIQTFVKKKFMDILELLCSIGSIIFTMLFYTSSFNEGMLYWISLAISIVLTLILIVKLIFKK